MFKACLFLLVILPASCLGQIGGNSTFSEHMRIIDVICQNIDNDATLVKVRTEFSVDDSSGFTSEGYCYIDTLKKEIKKFVYKGYNDGITVKHFTTLMVLR